jgi:tRNA dimethylallyltransferase
MSVVKTATHSLNSDLIALAGPTGAGKSEFACELASRMGAEILCADAFQVYQGLGVLTAQPDSDLLSKVSHHFYGCIDPKESFDAAQFAARIQPNLERVRSAGKRPMLVGGSGLYFRALLDGFDPLPPVDPGLRESLAARTLPDLIKHLQELDPEAVHRIDLKNPRRVARALEIVLQTGRPLVESWQSGKSQHACGILLTREREELRDRIARNVDSMFEKGVIEEVAAVKEIGPTASRAIGLCEIRQVLMGVITVEAAKETIKQSTWQYAKRQGTWFRNQTSYREIPLGSSKSLCKALDEAVEALTPPHTM